jgi:hypothetical protein
MKEAEILQKSELALNELLELFIIILKVDLLVNFEVSSGSSGGNFKKLFIGDFEIFLNSCQCYISKMIFFFIDFFLSH